MNDALTARIVDLLRQLIRNQGVNDGTVASGPEVRTSDVLRFLGSSNRSDDR